MLVRSIGQIFVRLYRVLSRRKMITRWAIVKTLPVEYPEQIILPRYNRYNIIDFDSPKAQHQFEKIVLVFLSELLWKHLEYHQFFAIE